MIGGGKKLPEASVREGKSYRLVVVSFGLLLILQATLNISLRLYATTPDFEGIIQNLTEEVDKLKENANNFYNYTQQGWMYFKNSFYYLSTIKKSWNESRDDCLHKGAHLVIINSKDEHDFTRQFRRLMWIGLTDAETEGTWKWVDGNLLNTSYWGSGEPNAYKGTDEDCGEILIYEYENSWNDASCENKNFWICEIMMSP